MKTNLIVLTAALALALAGCASSRGHSMACGKCACKMMRPSAADPRQCAQCGHGASEHKQPADGAAAAEHQH